MTMSPAVDHVLEFSPDFLMLYESALASLYRNSSLIRSDAEEAEAVRRVRASSFLFDDAFSELRPHRVEHKRILLPAIGYVGGLDEEDLVSSFTY